MATSDAGSVPMTYADANLPASPAGPGERPATPLGPPILEVEESDGMQPVATGIASPLSLGSLVKAFRHRWLLALAAGWTLFGLFAVAAWYWFPAKYTASALLRVAEAEPLPLIPDQRVPATPADRYFENTQMALIKSRPILLAALQRPEVADLDLVRTEPDPAAWLEQHLHVVFLEKTDILHVSLDGTNPNELAALVNAVKDAYMEGEVNAQRNKKLTQLEDVEKVYLSSDAKIRGQRSALRDLAQRLQSSDTQALGVKQKAILDEYASLRRELSLLQAQLRGTEIALAVRKTNGDNPGTVVSEAALEQAVEVDPLVIQKNVELAQFDSRISQLVELTEPGHPMRARYEKERQGLEKAREEIRTRLRTSLGKQVQDRIRGDRDLKDQQSRENLEVWRQQEKLLQAEVDRVLKEAQNIGIATFELELKRGELEQAEAVIKRLREEKERLQVELQSSKQRVSVLHAAEVPSKKNVVAQARIVGLAGGLGLLLGLFGVCYVEARAHRIRTKEEMVEVLGCRVVGVLPWVNAAARRGDGPVPDSLVRLTASVDDLRARLLCEAEEQQTGRVLMVTSAVAREGKTTLASHLAVSVAHAGRRTLLIDGDLRRPQMHRAFDLPRGPGLSEVLSGQATVAEAVRPGPLDGLSILTAGEDSHQLNFAQVLPQMRQLLEDARKEFDFILLDSSPVLPVADALLLGKRVDGVLLSVRPTVSQFPLVSAAFERLASLRIPLLGTVVNGVRSGPTAYDDYLLAPPA